MCHINHRLASCTVVLCSFILQNKSYNLSKKGKKSKNYEGIN